MATALVANSGSRSFIQVSKTVQANLVPLENDADGALAGTAQAKFRMRGHVLGEILDAPVGLTDAGRIEIGAVSPRLICPGCPEALPSVAPVTGSTHSKVCSEGAPPSASRGEGECSCGGGLRAVLRT